MGMNFSDIKVGYIYNLLFGEVRPQKEDKLRLCEFDGKHLALVLKENNDNETFIVMPLTSEPSGEGVNKIKLPLINALPTSLKCNDTFAVINQIRTVNHSRFISLKENADRIDVKLDDDLFEFLLFLGIKEITYNVSTEKKIELFKKLYYSERIVKAKDLAYNILKLKKNVEDNEIIIEGIKQDLRVILYDIPYDSLEQKYINDGIKDIFDEVTKNT
jgi:uncharacterized protein YifN (PemK superfamily)